MYIIHICIWPIYISFSIVNNNLFNKFSRPSPVAYSKKK